MRICIYITIKISPIAKMHPNAFHDIAERDFKSAVADVDARIPRMSDTLEQALASRVLETPHHGR
jgi:hypothetical protein